MTCKEIRDKLSEYIDHVLNEEDARLVEQHILQCGNCNRKLRKFIRMSEELHNLMNVEPPADSLEKLHKRIEERKSLDQFLHSIVTNPKVMTPVALTIIVVLVIAVVFKPKIYKTAKVTVEIEKDKITKVETKKEEYKTTEATEEKEEYKTADLETRKEYIIENIIWIESANISEALDKITELLNQHNIEIIFTDKRAYAYVSTEGLPSEEITMTIGLSREEIDTLISLLKALDIGEIIVPPQLSQKLKGESVTLHIRLKNR